MHHSNAPGPEVDPEPVKSRNLLTKIMAGILTLVVAWIITATIIGLNRQNQTTDQKNQAVDQATQGQLLAAEVQAKCAQGGDIARQLGKLCQAAADLKNTPVPGTPGVQGVPGPVGPQGPEGVPGSTVTGPQGVPGGTGPGGPSGDTGATGSSGEDGSQGQTGPKGDTGATGPAGPQGPEGPTGPGGEPAPRITNVSLDQASCTGTVTLSDGTSFPINMTGCTVAPIGGE